MNFPILESIVRDREYNSYSSSMRAQIVYGYLFQGMSHRALDSEVLGLNAEYSKGYQAMGILHFLGLKNKHKNFFANYSIDEAIAFLEKGTGQEYNLILDHLKHFQNRASLLNVKKFEEDFYIAVEQSKKDTSENRRKRLAVAPKKPLVRQVNAPVFLRNADVVAEVLAKANGICEECKESAPFLRKKDNTPYLEIHHCIPLAEGGYDTVDNAVALCPNCHRKMHFG